MLAELDLTLRALLVDPLEPPPLDTVDISFLTPDRTFTFAEATLALFLFGVRENRVLRDPVPIVEVVGGAWVRRMPPLRFDCDYLVTAWSKDAGAAAVAEERTILAGALAKLSRFPTIPARYLPGPQPFPVPMWVAQAEDGTGLGEFWTALGVAPRASFRLMVTIALDVTPRVPDGPPVTTREVTLHAGAEAVTSVFAVGGVVRDAAGVVAAARVSVDGGPSTTTDSQGRFAFSGLAAGAHTLRAEADGHAGQTLAVTIPAPAIHDYDITFAP